MKIYSLGQNCAWLSGFPMFYSSNEQSAANNELKLLNKSLKEINYKHQIVFTADYIQLQNHPILKKNGFKSILRFKSAHDDDDEILTVWVKNQKQFKLKTNKLTDKAPWNCSISFNESGRFSFTIAKTKSKILKLKKAGYLNILDTPFYYSIDEKYVTN